MMPAHFPPSYNFSLLRASFHLLPRMINPSSFPPIPVGIRFSSLPSFASVTIFPLDFSGIHMLLFAPFHFQFFPHLLLHFLRHHHRSIFCPPSRPLRFLLFALFFLFLLPLFCLFSIQNSQWASATKFPLCPANQQQMAQLYQLHSLAASPVPASSPLNWLHLRLWPIPSPRLLCPSSSSTNPNSPFSHTIAIVHSHLGHFQLRHFLRRQIRPLGLSAIFVLAAANASTGDLAQMEEEARTEGDLLVLANMEEKYRQMAHKTRAWIHWLNSNGGANKECHGPQGRWQPRLLLKIDDDVAVNWPALGRLISRIGSNGMAAQRVVLCRTIQNGQISRHPKSKWFLSQQEFRSRPGGLGLYCQGLAILMSWNLVEVATQNLRRVQFLWMDDWYLSNALLTGSNATFVDISPHIRNIDLEQQQHKDDIPPNPNSLLPIHYPPIFAHFRPAKQFPLERRIEEWEKMMEVDGNEQRKETKLRNGRKKCTL